MSNKIIGVCPVCNDRLNVTEITCNRCHTTIKGRFKLSKFDYLTPAQSDFALVFIKNAGNIKLIEKELGVSYPTVKKNIDDLISALGFERVDQDSPRTLSKEDIHLALRKGDITFEEAEELLEGLKQ